MCLRPLLPDVTEQEIFWILNRACQASCAGGAGEFVKQDSFDVHEHVREHFTKYDTFAAYLGIELVQLGAGWCKATMPLGKEQSNGVGLAHGGAIFALADVAFGGACNSSGTVALGIVSSINYLAPGKIGPLRAEAREVHRSKKLGHYEIVVCDGEGKTLAICQATAYYRGDLLPGVPQAG